MTPRTKWSITGAIGTVILVAAVAVAATRGPKSVAVKIEPVGRRDLVASVTASGQVEPHTKVDISADISGRIIKLAVKEGRPSEGAAAAADRPVRSTRPPWIDSQAAAGRRRTRRRRAGRGQRGTGPAQLRSIGPDQEGEPATHLRRAARAATRRRSTSPRRPPAAAHVQVEQAAAAQLRDAQSALSKTTIAPR